jgi:hypothetical protein
MSCPHLKEVVMLFCDAYPVKKMLPLDRIASAHPCLGRDFDRCPLYCELMARLANGCDECSPEATSAAKPVREVRHVARPAADPSDSGPARPVRH